MVTEIAAVAAVVKTLTDLAGELDKNIKDNRTRELFLPVKEKVLQVQQTFLQFQGHNLDLKHKHLTEIADLNAQHRKEMDNVRSEVLKLQTKLNELQSAPKAQFSTETGTWIDGSVHYCPKCWQDHKHSPMQTLEHYWHCPSCDKYIENPNNPSPGIIRADNDAEDFHVRW